MRIAAITVLWAHLMGCGTGFVRDSDGPPCDEQVQCGLHATCSFRDGIAVCRCRDGWQGDGQLCEDIDECANEPGRCSHGGTCLNHEGGYSCGCPDGFEQDDGLCVDIDECSAGTHDCVAPLTCTNAVGSFMCVCPEGYDLGSGSCDTCARGWVETSPGVCEAGDIDCSQDPGVCSPGGACVSADGGDRCECDTAHEGLACADCSPGYQDNDHDSRCAPSCETATIDCPAHQQCDDSNGTATCICSRGYQGEDCSECATGFADALRNGSCVAITCATALLECSAHAACFDSSYPPSCHCDIGWSGEHCDACAPTHSPAQAPTDSDDSSGVCIPNLDLDPSRFIFAAGLDELDRHVLGAIDIQEWTFSPITELAESVVGLTSDPMGSIYALGGHAVVRLDPLTGEREVIRGFSSTIHRTNGIAFDTLRRQIYVGASTGASKYLLTVIPEEKGYSKTGTSMNTLDQLGLAYHQSTDTVIGVGGHYSSTTTSFAMDAPSGSNFASGAAVDVLPNLYRPSLAYLGETLYLAGQRTSTRDEWVEAYCRALSSAVGVDTRSLPAHASYLYNGVGPGGVHTLLSDSDGPVLHARGSYGSSTYERGTLRIETDQPGDVICLATSEQNLDIVVDAEAQFRLMIVVSRYATPQLVVESGFVAADGASSPPMVAYATQEAADPSFEHPLAVVHDDETWSSLGMSEPSYNLMIAATPLAGTLSFSDGSTQLDSVPGIRVTGGIAAVPCCMNQAAPAYCDASGRVAKVLGTCDAAQQCQSEVVVLDDCMNRDLHPVVWSCSEEGAVEATPTCVESEGEGAACQLLERIDDVCDAPGSCVIGTGGEFEHTSPESCTATDDHTTCTETTSLCSQMPPDCQEGDLVTYLTSCSEVGGCSYAPTITRCTEAASHCMSGSALEYVSYAASCADASSCGTPIETRTECETAMCVNDDWVSYGTPDCDSDMGCTGDEISREACRQGESQRCVDANQMEWTRCTCTAKVGCECITTIEACPDREDECVGTSGRTLRTYQPYCDASTNTCKLNSPDRWCDNRCRVRTGPDTCE